MKLVRSTILGTQILPIWKTIMPMRHPIGEEMLDVRKGILNTPLRADLNYEWYCSDTWSRTLINAVNHRRLPAYYYTLRAGISRESQNPSESKACCRVIPWHGSVCNQTLCSRTASGNRRVCEEASIVSQGTFNASRRCFAKSLLPEARSSLIRYSINGVTAGRDSIGLPG